MKRLAIAAFLLAIFAVPAHAHSPVKGIGTFYNGMLHPYLVPAHVLVLLALGLMIGRHAPGSSRYSLPIFMLTLSVAVALVPWLHIPARPEIILLAVSLLAGLMVAASIRPGAFLAIPIALVAGAVLGLDSSTEGVPPEQIWLALAGTVCGACLALVYAGGLSAWLSRFPSWPPIAVRVLGSWTSACAFLVLVLEYAKSGAAT